MVIMNRKRKQQLQPPGRITTQKNHNQEMKTSAVPLRADGVYVCRKYSVHVSVCLNQGLCEVTQEEKERQEKVKMAPRLEK